MQRGYDLQERLIGFGVLVCALCEGFPDTRVGNHVAGQLVRSGTSPFANYAEAQGGASRKEFVYRLTVVRRELRESYTWMAFATRVRLATAQAVHPLLDECDQLLAIVSTVIRTAREGSRKKAQHPREKNQD